MHKTIYIYQMHGEYDFFSQDDIERKCHSAVIFDGDGVETLVDNNILSYQIQMMIGRALPEFVLRKVSDLQYGFLISVSGTDEKHRQDADAFANYLIPIVYGAGGDDDFYDYIPSAVDELIQYCTQIGYWAPLQKLYDSIFEGPSVHIQAQPDSATWGWVIGDNRTDLMYWGEKNSYHPDHDVDLCLYDQFNSLIQRGHLNRHADHPVEEKESKSDIQ